MNRKHTVVHLVPLVAIVIGLFSPILTLPVIAEDELPDSEITLETGDGTTDPQNIKGNGEIDTGENDRVDVDEVLTYTITVENTGNTPIYDLVVTDNMPGLVWESDLTLDVLPGGESATFTATYVVTQADIDAGQIVNTASVDASREAPLDDAAIVTVFAFAQAQEDDPLSISVSVTETTQIVQEPGVALVKSSDANGDLTLGETVTYTFTITNTGNVTLTGLELVDALDGVEFTSTIIPDLAPGASTELTATYIVAQPDVDAGEVENCAEVTAMAPDESTIEDEDCVTDSVAPNPIPEPTATSTPEPTETPTVPATPAPTDPPSTPDPEPDPTAAVTGLPETGSGGIGTVTPILWVAGVIGSMVMCIGAMGMRKRT